MTIKDHLTHILEAHYVVGVVLVARAEKLGARTTDMDLFEATCCAVAGVAIDEARKVPEA